MAIDDGMSWLLVLRMFLLMMAVFAVSGEIFAIARNHKVGLFVSLMDCFFVAAFIASMGWLTP